MRETGGEGAVKATNPVTTIASKPNADRPPASNGPDPPATDSSTPQDSNTRKIKSITSPQACHRQRGVTHDAQPNATPGTLAFSLYSSHRVLLYCTVITTPKNIFYYGLHTVYSMTAVPVPVPFRWHSGDIN